MTAQISLKALLAFLAVQLVTASGAKPRYPELRTDLQRYQDSSKCYPDVGEWYLMYRNYYADPDFGGTESCVKYSRYGDYENFSSPALFTFGQNGFLKGKMTLSSTPCYTGKNKKEFVPYQNGTPIELLHIVYIDCKLCFIARHEYADNGYGCSYWRRVDTLDDPADCCDFIYDENCGTSPKYKMYDSTCTFGVPTDLAEESGSSDNSESSENSDSSGNSGSSDSSSPNEGFKPFEEFQKLRNAGKKMKERRHVDAARKQRSTQGSNLR